MSVLELTGAHVASLGDEDLRILVVKLCEAELRRTGRPSSAVLAGGNQTASDGGIDVRIQLEPKASDALVGDSATLSVATQSATTSLALDFIPRPDTGFQVKCEDMPAGSITEEMKPEGALRESIKELISKKGAYVIVSSKGTVADKFLAKRLQAMQEAIADQPSHSDLKLDFYDRDRLARWVRQYPGVEMWLRDRVSARLQGWQSYGHWAGADIPYQLDDKARLVERTGGEAPKALPIAEGLGRLRAALSKPGEVIRIVGLSGTGKTRFVQALFEEGIGKGAPLDQAIVLYTDTGHEPEPSAREMLLRLGALEQRAIVVVDNCNPKTHRVLADGVTQYKHLLSLLTVEYDVADDDTPDETDVYELAPASDHVLEGILQRLAPHVTGPDRYRIIEFSGGNARIALALARTVKKGETLGILNNAELFHRLFRQGQGDDPELFGAAKVCALVYSFDGIDTQSDASELKVLARLAGLTPNELYRHVANLKRRDLVQARSKWRAVLPPALANRLAKLALQDIPAADITDAFEESERLLISFSRRLEYLHDSEEACAIASRWIDDKEWLADPTQLNELGRRLFINLAPLVPNKVLAAMERALSEPNREAFVLTHKHSLHQWSTLLRHLAYQPASFDKAALLLLALAEHEEGNNMDCREAWKEMFRISLSGTLAPPEQRVKLLEKLLTASTNKRLELAWTAIDAMLEVSQITSSHDFSFGARPQSYGWEPDSHEEVVAWFESAFALMRRIATSGSAGLKNARSALANHFREIWTCGVERQVAELMLELAGNDGWPAGWEATRVALRFDSSHLEAESLEALKILAAEMAPKGLAQEIRAYTLARAWGVLDLVEAAGDGTDKSADDTPERSIVRMDEKVIALGATLAVHGEILDQVLPDLLSDDSGRQYQLGLGLGKASADVQRHWVQLYDVFAQLPGESNASLLVGFLHGVRTKHPDSAFVILDSLQRDAKLDQYYPDFLGGPHDDSDGDRLIEAMKRSVARPNRYHLRTHHHGADAGLSVAKFCEAIETLALMENGLPAAIDQLGIELYQWTNRKATVPAELILLARHLLLRFSFNARIPNISWRLNELGKLAFSGPDASDTAKQFAIHFAAALNDYRTHADDYGELACTLFKLQPVVALDAFSNNPNSKPHLGLRARFVSHHGPLIQCAPQDVVLQWVKDAPLTRAPFVALGIDIFASKTGEEDTSTLEDGVSTVILSPLAAQLLEITSDKASVLQSFSKHFHPTHWSGSLAQTLAPYLELLESLTKHEDMAVSNWAHKALRVMQQRIENDRTRDILHEQTFE